MAVTIPDKICKGFQISTILGPLVLAADLLLLLGCEVVGDVEGLSDLFWRLALDHVGDSLATNIEKGLDIEVVGSLRQTISTVLNAPKAFVNSRE